MARCWIVGCRVAGRSPESHKPITDGVLRRERTTGRYEPSSFVLVVHLRVKTVVLLRPRVRKALAAWLADPEALAARHWPADVLVEAEVGNQH